MWSHSTEPGERPQPQNSAWARPDPGSCPTGSLSVGAAQILALVEEEEMPPLSVGGDTADFQHLGPREPRGGGTEPDPCTGASSRPSSIPAEAGAGQDPGPPDPSSVPALVSRSQRHRAAASLGQGHVRAAGSELTVPHKP